MVLVFCWLTWLHVAAVGCIGSPIRILVRITNSWSLRCKLGLSGMVCSQGAAVLSVALMIRALSSFVMSCDSIQSWRLDCRAWTALRCICLMPPQGSIVVSSLGALLSGVMMSPLVLMKIWHLSSSSCASRMGCETCGADAVVRLVCWSLL